jgi:hypothetical protein
MGPAWDYDWTWNASYVVPTNEWWTSQYYYNETDHWYKYLTKDPYFIVQAYEQYQEIAPSLDALTEDGGLIDTWASKYEKSAEADLNKWHTDTDYQTAVDEFKAYGSARFSWMDEQFSSVETLASSLGYTASDKVEVTSITNEDGTVRVTAQVTESSATEVTFHVNGILVGSANVTDGTATISVPSSLLKDDSTALNTVQVRLKDSTGEYLTSSSGSSSNGNSYGGWGSNDWSNSRNPWSNWWEDDTDTSSSSDDGTVLSNFKTFTLAELGVEKASATLLGDLNCDGVVNILYVLSFKDYRLYSNQGTNHVTAVGIINSDLDQDGECASTLDLFLLKKKILNFG